MVARISCGAMCCRLCFPRVGRAIRSGFLLPCASFYCASKKRVSKGETAKRITRAPARTRSSGTSKISYNCYHAADENCSFEIMTAHLRNYFRASPARSGLTMIITREKFLPNIRRINALTRRGASCVNNEIEWHIGVFFFTENNGDIKLKIKVLFAEA